MRISLSWAVAALAAVAIAEGARAQEPVGGAGVSRQDFSYVTGETVGAGRDMVGAQFGWPSVAFDYKHGLSPVADVGARFELIYGVEGIPEDNSQFGILLSIPVRGTVYRRDKISVQLHIDPGFTVYTYSDAVFMLNFPVGATLGVAVAPNFRIAMGIDAIMKLQVTQDAHFWFEPMFGPALEYFVDRQLSISLDTRFGPVIHTGLGPAQFGFRTQVGIAYRL
jgi:hypothetical protein